MTHRDLLIWAISRIMGRTFAIDPALRVSTLAASAFATVVGLVRGVIQTRQRVVLSRGARVRSPSQLSTAGGLVRFEEYSLVDCASLEGISLGRNFKLGAHWRMIASGSIRDLGKGIVVGDNVGISEFTYIGGAGGVVIGSDCIVGQYLSVHPEDHVFTDPERPIRDQRVLPQGDRDRSRLLDWRESHDP